MAFPTSERHHDPTTPAAWRYKTMGSDFALAFSGFAKYPLAGFGPVQLISTSEQPYPDSFTLTGTDLTSTGNFLSVFFSSRQN